MASFPREGTGVTETLEGNTVFTGMTRLPDSGWVVAIGIPSQAIDASVNHALVVYGLGIAASFALCAWLALLAARRISDPILQLRQAAEALGRGAPVQPLASGISELDQVGQALSDAAEARARTEVEKDRLRAAEHEALQHAQRASRAKDEFLAMLGHELRNPLAPIVNTLELLRLRGDRQMEPQLQIIKRQVSHMTRLVEDLLDVSRIAAGRLELNDEPVEVNGVVERAMEAVGPLMEKRVRPVELSMSAQPLWVRGDAERLLQVVTNLLTNALKFTAPDRGIFVRTSREGELAQIVVEDQGAGIAEELLPRVFELFSQAQQPLARRSGGLGLGLAIVRNLVEMHKGSVSAHSGGPGAGSRFTVTLPLTSEAATQAPTEHARTMAGPAGRILVVDDNVDAADTAAAVLITAGHEVHCAYDAVSALQLFERFAPQICVLDIGLPDTDGYELAGRIRTLPHGADTILIALTGYGQRTDRERAMQAGFAEHLTKPVEWATLSGVVARLLRATPVLPDPQ